MKKAVVFISFLLVFAASFSATAYSADGTATEAGYRIQPVLDRLAAMTDEDIEGTIREYADISANWARADIARMINLDIVTGVAPGRFSPDTPLQIDHFLKMVERSLGYSITEERSDWSKAYIETAKETGLVLEGEFKTYDKPVTREQTARIIVRASNMLEACPDSKYDNYVIGKTGDYAKVSDPCKQFVIKAYELGLINPAGGRFNPTGVLKRADAAALIMRLLDGSRRMPLIPGPDETIRFTDADGNIREVYPGIVREYFDIAKVIQDSIPLAKGYVSFGINADCSGGDTFYKDLEACHNNVFDAIGLFDISIDNPKYPDSTSYQITVYNDALYKELFSDYSHAVLKILFGEDADKAIALHDKYMNMVNDTGRRIWEETRLNNRKVGAFRDPGSHQFAFSASIIGKK